MSNISGRYFSEIHNQRERLICLAVICYLKRMQLQAKHRPSQEILTSQCDIVQSYIVDYTISHCEVNITRGLPCRDKTCVMCRKSCMLFCTWVVSALLAWELAFRLEQESGRCLACYSRLDRTDYFQQDQDVRVDILYLSSFSFLFLTHIERQRKEERIISTCAVWAGIGLQRDNNLFS